MTLCFHINTPCRLFLIGCRYQIWELKNLSTQMVKTVVSNTHSFNKLWYHIEIQSNSVQFWTLFDILQKRKISKGLIFSQLVLVELVEVVAVLLWTHSVVNFEHYLDSWQYLMIFVRYLKLILQNLDLFKKMMCKQKITGTLMSYNRCFFSYHRSTPFCRHHLFEEWFLNHHQHWITCSHD